MRKATKISCTLSDFSREKTHADKENETDASTDKRAVDTDPEQILLHLVIDEMIEFLIGQARQDIPDNNADERLCMKCRARQEVVKHLSNDFLEFRTLLDKSEHMLILDMKYGL